MTATLLLCTCPDLASARTLARSLVESRLAACVSLIPGVESIYRWQGEIECSDEVQLLIKTQAARLDEVERHILARHPYELPEILAVQAGPGLDRYLAWIDEETSPPAAGAAADDDSP